MERVRDARDDLEADERGDHEQGDFGDEIHQASVVTAAAGAGSCLPATHAFAITSSDQSSARFPSESTISSTKARMLRAYRFEADSGIEAGRLSGEAIVTPCSTTVSPAFVSAVLPPESPAMS